MLLPTIFSCSNRPPRRGLAPRSLAAAVALAAACAAGIAAAAAGSAADPIAAAEAEMLILGLPTARIVETEQGPTVLAVAQVRFEASEGPRAALRAAVAASVRARAAVAALLEGREIETSSRRLYTRLASDERGATAERTTEQRVRIVVRSVLASVATRRCDLDFERGMTTVVLESAPRQWTRADAFGVPRYADAAAAAEGVARELAALGLPAVGAVLVRLDSSGEVAAVGLGAAALREGQSLRDGRLIAGRRAAAAVVAYLGGEEVRGTDELQTMMRQTVRSEPGFGTAPGPDELEISEQFNRTAESMVRGVRPPGSVERDSAARLGGERLVFAALVVPIAGTAR